jgi:hypothetical protein
VEAVAKAKEGLEAVQPTNSQIVARTPEMHGSLEHTAGAHPKAKDSSLKGRALEAWGHFKHEMQHYWYGSKLLGKEVSICFAIVKQITRGEELSRREYRQVFFSFSFFFLVSICFAIVKQITRGEELSRREYRQVFFFFLFFFFF